MKFINRIEEQKALLNLKRESTKHARFTYIVGKRRIGKTHLIKQVYFQKKHSGKKRLRFYFFVQRKDDTALLAEFQRILAEQIDYVPSFQTFQDFLFFIFEYTKENPLTIVFDEFQNFNYVSPSLYSTLQMAWDSYKDKSKINLIVIGSIYSLMTKIFSSKHEPLFGRATNKIHLKEFTPATIWEILRINRIQNFDKLLILYTIFGGVAQYYEQLRIEGVLDKNFRRIFRKLFLNVLAPLRSEGKNLLVEEFGTDYQTYFGVLEAIAVLPKPTNQKIAQYIGKGNAEISSFLDVLSKKYDLIERRVPIFEMRSKKGRYYIKDKFLDFWFQFVYKNSSKIEILTDYNVFLNKSEVLFQTRKGLIFEDLVRQIIQYDYKQFDYDIWGSYWNKNLEVDIVAMNKQQKTLLVGECKLNSKSITSQVLEDLYSKSEYLQSVFSGYNQSLYLFVGDVMSKKQKDLVAKMNLGIRAFDSNDLIKVLKIKR